MYVLCLVSKEGKLKAKPLNTFFLLFSYVCTVQPNGIFPSSAFHFQKQSKIHSRGKHNNTASDTVWGIVVTKAWARPFWHSAFCEQQTIC